MFKIILQQPQFVTIPTPASKSISSNSGESESHIWGHWSPYQGPEITQNIHDTALFYLTLFWMSKIMLMWSQFIHLPTPSNKSYSPNTRDSMIHISGPLGLHQSPETSKNTPITGWHSSAWLKSYCGCLNLYLYPPHLKMLPCPSQGTLNNMSGATGAKSEPRNSPKYP